VPCGGVFLRLFGAFSHRLFVQRELACVSYDTRNVASHAA
jgi:hypothetical protein